MHGRFVSLILYADKDAAHRPQSLKETSMLKDYVLSRLREASTWRGIVLALTAVGIQLTPDQTAAVISVGMSLVAAIAVFLPDQKA